MSCTGRLLTLTIAFGVCGCTTYSPLPLNDDVVDRALSLPSSAELKSRIAAMNNPLIHADHFDLDDGLTPEEAAVFAVAVNPALRVERDRPLLAEARLLQAGILPNPTLNYSLDVPIGSRTSGEVSGYGLGVDWEITSLITRDAKVKAATAARGQVRLDLSWKEWQVAQAARQAAYDVIALREQKRNATRLSTQLDRIAERAAHSLKKHDITATDASAAQAAADDSRVTLSGTERDLRDAELALNLAIGVPHDATIKLADQISLPTLAPTIEANRLLTGFENRRFDLVALRRGYASQEEGVRAAVLGQFPKITLGISNTRDFGNFLTLGPSLAVDLPFFDRNQGNIAIERATRQQLLDEYISRVFEARSDIARAVALLHSLDDVISAQEQQVRSLQSLVTSDERALQSGNIDAATFYAAAVSLSQKQVDLTKLKLDLIHAQINLELAAGVSLSAETDR